MKFTMQHVNEKLIESFYQAFQRLDWESMADCYGSQVVFSDSVFISLNAQEVIDMWHMLCSNARDFELSYSHINADEHSGSARWVVTYRFSQTGRLVKNVIFAEFQFSEGKITRHSDHFSFWGWSKSALGASGLLLGWSGYLRRKVQQQALIGLHAFSRKASFRKD